ncbi:glycosyltransferase family 4 protein, partial [Thermodesulfobacteriota bacterium]
VCLISNDFPPITAGISIYMKGLYEGFHMLGHDTFVIFSPINSNLASSERDVTTIPLYGKWTIQRVLSSESVLKKCRTEIESSDLVIVSSWSPMGTAYRSVFSDKRPKSVLLAHGNDILEPANSFIYKRWMKTVFNSFHLIATNSQYIADLCHRLTGRKAVPVGGGLDKRYLEKKDFESLKEKKRGRFTILSIGRLVERKGFDVVIKSLGKISNQLYDWHYVIIGEGPFKNELLRLAYDYNLNEKIEILSNVDFDELLDWYNIADIFIMVSRSIPDQGEVEGLGLVYMEAGSASVPVIAGDSGGVSDVVMDGVNGLLVNPLSVKETADAIVKLYRDAKLRKKLGLNGRNLAETEWRWDTVAKKIIEAV